MSNALTGRRAVNPATAERVRQEAKRLDYRVNRAARSLRTSRTDTIALCLSNNFEGGLDLSSDYLMQIVKVATDCAFAAGQRILLSPELGSLADAAALGVDGAVIMDPVRLDPQLDFFAQVGVPVVTIECDPGRPEHVWHVNCDNVALIRTLLDHLEAGGAERIVMVDRLKTVRAIPWADEITGAYHAWSAERQRPSAVAAIPGLEPFSPESSEVLGALLSGPERPDAIVTTFDFDGAAAARIAADLGLAIPGDVQIASAVDGTFAWGHRPALTAMDLMPREQAAGAVELLLARIAGVPPVAPPPLLTAQLRVRDSTH